LNARAKTNAWIDVLLLSSILLAAAGACGVLALMAWQAPQLARAANRPAMTWPSATPSPTPTRTTLATPTPTPSATVVPSPTAVSSPTPTATVNHPQATTAHRTSIVSLSGWSGKWIDVDISKQTLSAYEGATLLLETAVSTGKPYTPTPLGKFEIYARVPVQDMGGPNYLLRNVQYVAYFYKDYALHATYWHDNFGQPMSHGCVNLRTADAQWLYEWAPIGTPVHVHE
jgi:lipoprotein-anchoring transpeptidase ErfK/SrfK